MGDKVYHFQAKVIELVLVAGQTGNYVLGDKDLASEFYPRFIGRSDTDV